MLWPEQQHSLQFSVKDIVSNNGAHRERAGKKRKREGTSATAPAVEEASEEKRARTGLIAQLLSMFSFGLFRAPVSMPQNDVVRAPTLRTEASAALELVPTDASSPLVPANDCRSLVYMDLVRRGYLVGPGHVYGGDYNIYDRGKDPSSSHSMATVRAMSRPTVTARDLISFARVQNQVL